jgi:hypothetical protein
MLETRPDVIGDEFGESPLVNPTKAPISTHDIDIEDATDTAATGDTDATDAAAARSAIKATETDLAAADTIEDGAATTAAHMEDFGTVLSDDISIAGEDGPTTGLSDRRATGSALTLNRAIEIENRVVIPSLPIVRNGHMGVALVI